MLIRFTALLIFLSSVSVVAQTEELALIDAYPVQGEEGLQLSGLSECRGHLLTISDRHPQTIFELIIRPDQTAEARVFLRLDAVPDVPDPGLPLKLSLLRTILSVTGLHSGYDWEGITCDPEGNIYLLSEAYFSVLKVSPSGSLQWLGTDIYQKGYKKGYFHIFNAGLEGISWSEGGMLLAAERQPRGIITYGAGGPEFYPAPGQSLSSGQNTDYSAMDSWKHHLYLLERNAYRICRSTLLQTEKQCFSYRSSELDSRWRYVHSDYGRAEGLEINEQGIWIVLDNNGDGREQIPSDKGPLLLHLRITGR